MKPLKLRVNTAAHFLLLVVIPLFIFRTTFSGKLVGDLADARATLVQHEHWFRFFSGLENLSSSLMYWGSTSSMGYQDAYFFQGTIYSLLRAFHLSNLDAWQITQFALTVFYVFALGFLSRLFLRTTGAQVVFVIICSTSYPFVTQLPHVQTFTYSLAVFICALFISGLKQFKYENKAWQIKLAITLLPFLALSSWYPLVFILMFGAIYFALHVMFMKHRKSEIFSILRKAKAQFFTWDTVIYVSIFTILTSAWITIYGAAASGPKRSWIEYATYAPEWSDLINVSDGDGIWANVFSKIGAFANLTTFEKAGGIPPLLFAIFAIFSINLLARIIRGTESSLISLKIVLSVFALWVLIIVDSRGYGLYRLFWDTVPGATSIRAALRINILLVIAIAGFVLATLESTARRTLNRAGRTLLTICIAGLCLLLVAEEQRSMKATWSSSEFVPLSLKKYVPELQNAKCEAFLLATLAPKDQPWYEYQVDALALAVESGKPTINGYAAILPDGYPSSVSTDIETLARKADWAQSRGVSGICILTDTSIRYLK